MKTYFKLISLSLLTLLGCRMNNSDITQIETDLLRALNSEMELSLAYNDSLFSVMISNGDEAIGVFYDEMFHFHDSLYDAYHDGFSHRSSFEDHHHDSHGMHQSQGMMNTHSGTEGHHIAHHQTMDSLQISHEDIHPDH